MHLLCFIISSYIIFIISRVTRLNQVPFKGPSLSFNVVFLTFYSSCNLNIVLDFYALDFKVLCDKAKSKKQIQKHYTNKTKLKLIEYLPSIQSVSCPNDLMRPPATQLKDIGINND